MSILSTIGNIAGSVIGAVGGFLGQQSANESNQQIAATNTAFNAAEALAQRNWASEQASINRAFQAEQSSNAWQRGVNDMRASGLNPMLAFSQGPASAPSGANPSGAAATAVQPAPMLNKLAAAAQAAQSLANVQQTQAQVEKTKAETANVETDTKRRTLEMPYDREYVVLRQMKELQRLTAESDISRWDAYIVEKWLRNTEEQRREIESRIESNKARAAIDRLKAIEEKANADYFRDVGKGGIYWREGRAAAGTLLGITAAGRAAKVAKTLGQGLRPAMRWRAYGR